MERLIVVNGAFGEGGGQILRTSLALSLVTGKPFRIENIRANRRKPGLRHQHLTAVNAAAQISNAELQGNDLGSTHLSVVPGRVQPGKYYFTVSTAGSGTLVLQTVLPALILAEARSELVIEGGTHNPFAPSFDFLSEAFLPVLCQMGPQISASLHRPGFFPAGGGKFSISIEPTRELSGVELITRGSLKHHHARAMVANLPKHIAERELRVVHQRFSWPNSCLELIESPKAKGPGNVLTIVIACEHVTEVFTGFGQRGVSAERVAGQVVAEIHEYLDSDVPVGRFLADQLILPMALAGRGKFRTLSLTQHTLTNIEVVRQFLDITIRTCQVAENIWEIEVISPTLK